MTSSVLLHRLVYKPHLQNQLLRGMLYSPLGSTPELRRDLMVLEREGPWDPYLRGWSDLAQAQRLRKLGRHAEARAKYLQALSHRFPHHYWLELGLYEWELGLNEEARSSLGRAAEIHERLIREIDDPTLRAEVYKMIRSDSN